MSQSEYRSNQDGSITLTVPLEITVRLGVGGRNKMEPTVPNGTGIGGERVVPDRPYTNRNGYDPGFLPGFNVPFPRITSSAPGSPARLIQPTNGEDPTILKYEHFSVVMNADRKMAFVTAVNIDGAKSRSVDRRTGKVRPGIAERVMETVSESAEASETWYVDPRIPAEAQTDQSLYNSQRPHIFDRGHQVRREDPNWGADREAERANADTFHFANCCPQASPFNQQAQFWQGIENYVLDNTRAEDAKVSVFTGPVFASNDQKYRDIRVPAQFFKIVARVDDGQLKVVALLASQADFLNRLPERLGGERFDDLGRVRQYQTSVAEIESLTGLDFGRLRDADVFGDSETLDSPLRPLKAFRDVILTEREASRRAIGNRY